MTRGLLVALFAAVAVACAGCDSPEARRVRGGGSGADVGNRPDTVEMHGGSKMYHRAPCAVRLVACEGPPAVFTKRPA
jgi:hypothetical protein